MSQALPLQRSTDLTSTQNNSYIPESDKQKLIKLMIRAGHEPTMLYNLENDSFTEVKGNGLALGNDQNINYQEQELEIPAGNRLILIGSDDLTDIQNINGEHFGKWRLQQLIKRTASLPSDNNLKELS